MSKERTAGRGARAVRAFGIALATAVLVPAQHTGESAHPPAVDHNATAARPTHHPHPTLHPLRAWNFVKTGNEAYVASRTRRTDSVARHLPRRPVRPAGAGRYVCAVIVCADVEADLPELLGARARDLLVLRAPGPFVHRETTALLERLVVEERLSLVLVLGHAGCRALRPRRDRRPDALTARVARLQLLTGADKRPLEELLVRRQRERILAASDELGRRARADDLRVVPGVVDPTTGAIRWCATKVELMPVAPVK